MRDLKQGSQILSAIFIIIFIVLVLLNVAWFWGPDIEVSASQYQLIYSGGRPPHLELKVYLSLKNKSRKTISINRLISEFFVNGKRVEATQTKLSKPLVLNPKDQKQSDIQSMISNYGRYMGAEFKREIKVHLVGDGKDVYGPFTIDVPYTIE